MQLETVEKRFDTYRVPEVIEVLSDHGSAYTATQTRIFPCRLGLEPHLTPVAGPQSNGLLGRTRCGSFRYRTSDPDDVAACRWP